MDPEPMSFTLQVILIFTLTVLNAFFAAAEMAIVSVNRTRIKQLAESGDRKALSLLKLLEEPNLFLSTIQVGITLAGFFSSASAATTISKRLGIYLASFGFPYAEWVSVVVMTLLLSYITLVLGELVPKRIALQKSQQLAMIAVKPIVLISKLAKPFVRWLSFSTNVVLRLFGLNDEKLEEKVSREEIKSLVDAGEEHGVINQIEKEMINSIFEFDDKLAKEVMTPRTEVYMINVNQPLAIEQLLEENYSRIPVYEDQLDQIVGVLYLKDVLKEAYRVGFDHVEVRPLLHSAYFVPECKNIDQLFKELQKSRTHLAFLIDEYGVFSGIVTIEDLIEEVMGEIEDEYDDDHAVIEEIGQGVYLVDGLISIKDLNEKLHLNLSQEGEDYETLGVFLLQQMNYIPNEGETCTVTYENFVFKIDEVKDRRIERVKIYIPSTHLT